MFSIKGVEVSAWEELPDKTKEQWRRVSEPAIWHFVKLSRKKIIKRKTMIINRLGCDIQLDWNEMQDLAKICHKLLDTTEEERDHIPLTTSEYSLIRELSLVGIPNEVR